MDRLTRPDIDEYFLKIAAVVAELTNLALGVSKGVKTDFLVSDSIREEMSLWKKSPTSFTGARD